MEDFTQYHGWLEDVGPVHFVQVRNNDLGGRGWVVVADKTEQSFGFTARWFAGGWTIAFPTTGAAVFYGDITPTGGITPSSAHALRHLSYVGLEPPEPPPAPNPEEPCRRLVQALRELIWPGRQGTVYEDTLWAELLQLDPELQHLVTRHDLTCLMWSHDWELTDANGTRYWMPRV